MITLAIICVLMDDNPILMHRYLAGIVQHFEPESRRKSPLLALMCTDHIGIHLLPVKHNLSSDDACDRIDAELWSCLR